MKAFVFVTILALVHARPEAGYTYSKPGVSFTSGHGGDVGIGVAPSGGSLLTQSFGHGDAPSFSGGQSFGGGSSFSSGGSFQTGGASSFHTGGVSSFQTGGSSFQTGGSGFTGGSAFNGGSAFTGGSGLSGGSALSGGSVLSGGSTFSGGASFAGADASFGHGGTTLVQKHIYVHVPPPEPEDIHHHRPISVAPAQKHYKIIFIKAPSPPTPTAPIIPLQPQNEEKTLVYVLVKKPDEQPDIHIPTPAPTQPSKPEVYFIKYKAQKEIASGGAIGGIQQVVDHGTTAGSGVISNVQTGAATTGSEYNLSQSSLSSSSSSSSSSLSTSYGPPGHQPGPY